MPSRPAQAASISAGSGMDAPPPPELPPAGAAAALGRALGGHGADRLGDGAGEQIDGVRLPRRPQLRAQHGLGVRLRGGEQLHLMALAALRRGLARRGLLTGAAGGCALRGRRPARRDGHGRRVGARGGVGARRSRRGRRRLGRGRRDGRRARKARRRVRATGRQRSPQRVRGARGSVRASSERLGRRGVTHHEIAPEALPLPPLAGEFAIPQPDIAVATATARERARRGGDAPGARSGTPRPPRAARAARSSRSASRCPATARSRSRPRARAAWDRAAGATGTGTPD